MFDEVTALLREAAATEILPRFGALADDDIAEKSPGDLVTIADREAERMIGAGLRALLPGSTVVGEEAVEVDAALLGHITDAGPVWLVDPVDGTGNFAAGRPPFAVMVALLRGGDPVAGWILDPLADSVVVAERGGGTYRDGIRLTVPEEHRPLGELRGAASVKYFPPALRDAALDRGRVLGALLPGHHCAGREYPDVIEGEQDFAVFWRTKPWDHAAGALLTREAGAVVRHLDGAEYHPADQRPGLMVARTARIWSDVHEALFDGPAFRDFWRASGPADDG
ncbi:inositol monophosphatase family protein [Rhizomonospora bruguierae]|uniref:inositol monophosphatase family protein n=1 Tax=Rhizomonospora bruguierae TaxID=1581705 RepID=UPI001BCE242C|nr:inositol monophosphatase family protein [Micromonospora sp. NBRC 107566]